jgi:hypothetical protein
MNRIRRDDAGDTGEQDVRELRRLYGGTPEAVPTLPLADAGPFVRDKEDVPHEDAIPDLYGLDNAPEEDEVEEVLLHMVEDGELCFGWLEDRQEFGFWYPEDEPVQPAAPTPEPAPEPARVSRRRPRRSLGRRLLLGLAATIAAPFAVGLCAYAAEEGEHHAHHPMDRPDNTSNDIPMGAGGVREADDADYQPQTASATPLPASASTKRPKHAKPSAHPETPRVKTTAAKHAKKPATTANKGPSALLSGTPTVKVTLPAPSTAPVPSTGKHEGPLSTVVNTLLAPVGALLGN